MSIKRNKKEKITNTEIYSFLNIISRPLGKLYKLSGFNPLPEDFCLSQEVVEEALQLLQMRNDEVFVPFEFESKQKFKKIVEKSSKNCKKMAKNVKNLNFSEDFAKKFETYLLLRAELSDQILKKSKGQDFDELDAFREIHNLNPIFGDLLDGKQKKAEEKMDENKNSENGEKGKEKQQVEQNKKNNEKNNEKRDEKNFEINIFDDKFLSNEYVLRGIEDAYKLEFSKRLKLIEKENKKREKKQREILNQQALQKSKKKGKEAQKRASEKQKAEKKKAVEKTKEQIKTARAQDRAKRDNLSK